MAAALEELRARIDRVDREIILLLSERFKLTEEVGIYKASNRLNVQDHTREAGQFAKISALSESCGLNPGYASEIYRCIIDTVISRHQELQEA